MRDHKTPFNADFPQEVFPGWNLIGRYESDVGSWLLTSGREALLLEVPEGLMTEDVRRARTRVGGPNLLWVTASHEHWDHFDEGAWALLRVRYGDASFIHPGDVRGVRRIDLGGEPLYLIQAPKHSPTDVVVVFRGVAMTGDLELGTLTCCGDGEWDEADLVPIPTRVESFRRLRDFPRTHGYHVHTVVSAHLDDVRTGLSLWDWEGLFEATLETAK